MPASTYLANKLLEHQVGKTPFTMPTVYVALSSTTPSANGTGVTEPSGGSYARVATAGTDWGTAASGAITNSNAFSFPQATADWVGGSNLTYAVLYDAASGGNMLAYGALTTPKSVTSGDTVSIAAGDFDITLT